jgi:hypothetical protein
VKQKAALKAKELRLQINGNINYVSSADENKQ